MMAGWLFVNPNEVKSPLDDRTKENSANVASVCICVTTRFLIVCPIFQCPAWRQGLVGSHSAAHHDILLLQGEPYGIRGHRRFLQDSLEARRHTELMSQDSNNLRLLALLDERVIQHDALVLKEPIPAHAHSHLWKRLSVLAARHMVQQVTTKGLGSAMGGIMSVYKEVAGSAHM